MRPATVLLAVVTLAPLIGVAAFFAVAESAAEDVSAWYAVLDFRAAVNSIVATRSWVEDGSVVVLGERVGPANGEWMRSSIPMGDWRIEVCARAADEGVEIIWWYPPLAERRSLIDLVNEAGASCGSLHAEAGISYLPNAMGHVVAVGDPEPVATKPTAAAPPASGSATWLVLTVGALTSAAGTASAVLLSDAVRGHSIEPGDALVLAAGGILLYLALFSPAPLLAEIVSAPMPLAVQVGAMSGSILSLVVSAKQVSAALQTLEKNGMDEW